MDDRYLVNAYSTVVLAAATCYTELILKESDNNIKLIVLDRIDELKGKFASIISDLVMDILRVLTSPDIEVRRKCLNIALEMTTNRNVMEVAGFLKKEIAKTYDQDYEKNLEYRQLLVHAIHTCAMNFPEVTSSVIYVLMEFLTDTQNASGVDVVTFVREVFDRFGDLRSEILPILLETFPRIGNPRVFRGALWIVGEYSLTGKDIETAFYYIRQALGSMPLTLTGSKDESIAESTISESEHGHAPKHERKLLPDGTYATQTALVPEKKETTTIARDSKPSLRRLLLSGEFLLGSVLAVTLTKLVLRYRRVVAAAAAATDDESTVNALIAESMLIMTSIIRVGRTEMAKTPMDDDSYERILTCLRVLSNPSDLMEKVFLELCKNSFVSMMEVSRQHGLETKKLEKQVQAQVDSLIEFKQLCVKNSRFDRSEDEYEGDLIRATGKQEKEQLVSKLSRVVQLSGFSDPVYVEAYLNVHQYDIVLEILAFNQTNDTLQNLTLELATLGDLKLVEKPGLYALAPRSFLNFKASMKVSSTETGIIFANLIYDRTNTSESNCIVLNDIVIDVMDYIRPNACSETQFRTMWAEFEWENKVQVNTKLT
jgi:coatomer subunit beta